MSKKTFEEALEEFDPNKHMFYCSQSFFEENFKEHDIHDIKHFFVIDNNNFMEGLYIIEKELYKDFFVSK